METFNLTNNNFPEAIKKTLIVLSQGGLVIAPSDTVYGALVDAQNDKAVQKLIAFKNRPIGKSISVFMADFSMTKKYIEVTSDQEKMVTAMLPGSFTIVLPSKHHVSKLLESEKGTLGIRVPYYPFITSLVHLYKKPITATSANLAGRSPHYSIASLMANLPDAKKKLIDLVIDAGKLPRNKPSTVMDLSGDQIKILRKGDIMFIQEEKFTSHSPKQTKKFAQSIVKKYLAKKPDRPLIFLLQGELGVGKTIFVKGAAEIFNIKNIISPTFTVYYEYQITKHPWLQNFYHFDLYNIEEKNEFEHLGINLLLKKEHIFFIEWGEKTGEILEFLQKKAKLILIKLRYISDKERLISYANEENDI